MVDVFENYKITELVDYELDDVFCKQVYQKGSLGEIQQTFYSIAYIINFHNLVWLCLLLLFITLVENLRVMQK